MDKRFDTPPQVKTQTPETTRFEAMTVSLSDTQPETERVQFELLRQAPAWRKLEMLAQLNQTAHTLALSGLRQRYPQASPGELHHRLADLLLGQILVGQVYGPLPPTEPEPSYAL